MGKSAGVPAQMEGRPMTGCTRCHGDGFYFTVPSGFNPFLAGGHQTACVAYKVKCWCAAAGPSERSARPSGSPKIKVQNDQG